MHKGIHKRGYLPHWDFADSVQAVAFRLADSLPGKLVSAWRQELKDSLNHPDTDISRKAQSELHRKIARYEDAGHGECLLSHAAHGGIVQQAFIAGHGIAYKLIDWCVMPNHVHVLLRLLDETPLGNIIRKWKGATALEINRLRSRRGSVWMCDYHDRFIRDLDHFHNARAYIRNNPVKAGLCKKPEDWPLSSAGINWTADFSPLPKNQDAD